MAKNKTAALIFGIHIFFLTAGCTGIRNTETEWHKYPEFSGPGFKIMEYEESEEAFPNPMKGFRPASEPGIFKPVYNEYALVYKHYIAYNDLETAAGDSVQKIIDWCNFAWEGIEKKNIKIIPRVVMTHPVSNQPGAPSGNFWPGDIYQPSPLSRWQTEELKERLVKFIGKLGEAWDDDPRIAAIELGLWGNWGEHHLYPDARTNNLIPVSFQTALGTAFDSSFKNKKIMIRYPDTFTQYRFGFYWDSFALPDDYRGAEGMMQRQVWEDQMISGETAYDWGDRTLLGNSPDETLTNNRQTGHVVEWIKKIHASSLGWISNYTNTDNPAVKANAARIQKTLGYRFVIRSAVFSETAQNGEKIKIGLSVSNIGSAPFYYNWPLEISLLDQNRNLVFQKTSDQDINRWLPGGTNTIILEMEIPPGLQNGSYFLCAAIPDPSGNNPSLRFANKNYFSGGRTALGIIGIGVKPDSHNFKNFDLLAPDNLPGYKLKN